MFLALTIFINEAFISCIANCNSKTNEMTALRNWDDVITLIYIHSSFCNYNFYIEIEKCWRHCNILVFVGFILNLLFIYLLYIMAEIGKKIAIQI